ARSAMRPDMMAGPIERKWSLSNCCATGAVVCASARWLAVTMRTAGNPTRHTWRIIDAPEGATNWGVAKILAHSPARGEGAMRARGSPASRPPAVLVLTFYPSGAILG